MNKSMFKTHFLQLPDIVILEIFSYLFNEDALFAFTDSNDIRMTNLLTEYGTFRQIYLSSQLCRRQYYRLSDDIWRYDLVRSIVCKEMFSDAFLYFLPCQIFPSLIELKLLSVCVFSEPCLEFVIAHSSTLTRLCIQRSKQPFSLGSYEEFLQRVLPHLTQLKFLNIDWRNWMPVPWNQLNGCLQSLEYLCTFVHGVSDVYTLVGDGFLPNLRCLRVYINKSVLTPINVELPAIANLHMPKLERFDFHMIRNRGVNAEERQVEWPEIETLMSPVVMPCLRRCSFVFFSILKNEIQDVLQSSLFHDERCVSVCFKLVLTVPSILGVDESLDIINIQTKCKNKILLQHGKVNASGLQFIWFTPSWPSWSSFEMNHQAIVPRTGVRTLEVNSENVSLHTIAKLFPRIHTLRLYSPASLSQTDSSLVLASFITLRRLCIYDFVPGLEQLFDADVLPHVDSLDACIVPLFIALMRRKSQMKTLDKIKYLSITDQVDEDEQCFSIKHWYFVFDALSRLQTLLIQFISERCPPLALADLFVDYIRRSMRTSLHLFSCAFDERRNADKKEQFLKHLRYTIESNWSEIQFIAPHRMQVDAWI